MVPVAEVYKAGRLAAELRRIAGGTEFRYRAEYLASEAPPVASTLPRSADPLVTPAGAVPAFFAGLLPEGRRLSALRRSVKTSADDELSLLTAVGADTIGDVQVVPAGERPPSDVSALALPGNAAEVRFAELLRRSGIAARPSLAGVQDKASAAMLSLPVRHRAERFILKLDPPEFQHLVQNEAYFADLSRSSGMPTATARIITDADGQSGLLVGRFDRMPRDGTIRMIAVEDAAQAAGLWPADKYNVSFEQAAAALAALTAAPVVAAARLLEQLAFAWLTGNGDQHAKNLSVYEAEPGEFRVTPAYDLPSTVFYGDETLALTVEGRDTLTARRFAGAADALGVPRRAARRILNAALRSTHDLADRIETDALPFDHRVNAKAARTLRRRHAELAEGLGSLG